MDCICRYGGIPKMDKAGGMTYNGGKNRLRHIPRNTTFKEFIKKMESICSNNPEEFSVKHFAGEHVYDVTDEEGYESLFTYVERNPQYNPLKIWIVNSSISEPISSSLLQREVVISASSNEQTDEDAISVESSNSGFHDSSHDQLRLDIGQSKERSFTEDEVAISNLPSADKNIKTVLEWLRQEDIYIIGIKGWVGMGRTWTAKHVMDREANHFDVAIWVNVGEVSQEILAMQIQIVNQLKLLTKDKEDQTEEVTEENLRQKISMTLADKKFLLVLDEILYDSSYDLKALGVPLPSQQNRSSKVLIVGHRFVFEDIATDRVLSVDGLPQNEGWLLFREKAGIDNDSPVLYELAQPFILDCVGFPLDIITVAGALRKLGAGTSLTWEAKLGNLPHIQDWEGFLSQTLPSKVMKECFLYCTLYPQYHHISMKELTTSWILEGLLDGFNCLEKAYENGLYILNELMDRYLLFKVDENHVGMHESIAAKSKVNSSSVLLANAGLRLTLPQLGIEQGSFKKICLMNENLQIKYSDDAPELSTLSTLLIHGDGGHLLGELKDDFFEQMQKLQVLAVPHAKIWSFPPSFLNLKHLHVLVLKGPGHPENLVYIQQLQNLVILSLSGASNLKTLPDDFFELLLGLNALDLSNTQLKQLPKSITKIHSIDRLILRGCSCLETVPYLESLTVLDLSGASALKTIEGEFFHSGSGLKLLDLSGTSVDGLTSISLLPELEHLSLRGCSTIVTVPSPEAFRKLKVLDLSGATGFEGFQDEAPSNFNEIQVIDLSETQIAQFPSHCQNLNKIILRNCFKLEKLSLLGYNRLQVLDLSNSTALRELEDVSLQWTIQSIDLSWTQIVILPSFYLCYNLRELILRSCLCLEEIKDDCFEDLSGLEMLNLSGTLLEKLPDLSNCRNLKQLLMRECLNLRNLPQLTQLERLEVLDLYGATSLCQPDDEYFQNNFELRELNLSRIPQIVHLPSLSNCSNLRKLILRGCANLQTLPTLEVLARLKILDLSGATSFTTFQDKSFGHMYDLKILDLSGTQIVELPLLSGCLKLSQLLLRDCSNLVRLPHLKALTRLEVLDLAGATAFSHLDYESFQDNCGLQQLDLSRNPNIEKLPFISKCSNLSKLILRGCSKLKTLPPLEALTRLKVIDLSGATSFTAFQDESLGQKYDLQILDLSETQIAELPLLTGCVNLQQLLLRGCWKLHTLPHLKELTRLEVLDAAGNIELRQLQDESFVQNNVLKVLDLSRTKFTDFSFLFQCKSLHQLSLQQCLNLDELSFEGLCLLQKLDLSETQIKQLPSSTSELRNLSHLILKGCSNLETVPNLEKFTMLEVINLAGTKIKEFPHGISELTHLRFLEIQNRMYHWFDWENKAEVAKVLKWDLYHGSSSSSEMLDITANDADIVNFVEQNSQRFHLCLRFRDEREKEQDFFSLQGKDCVFGDVYYQTSQLPQLREEPNKFLKIGGLQSFTSGIKEVLSHVELLYLNNIAFITRLSDVGAENIKVMRECWIEKCDSMECVFNEEDEEENVALGKNLQGLWVSNLPKVCSLYQGEVQSTSFTCLRHLYIDCCPNLKTIFSSGMELQNLETLRIKFCDKLVSVFGVLEEQSLPQLHTLALWKLPALHSICNGAVPCLKVLNVKGCTNLQKLPLNGTSLSVVIRGEQQWWNKLNWGNSVTSHLHFIPLPQFIDQNIERIS